MERVRVGVNVREGESAGEGERERLSFNCCGAQNKYNRFDRSDRSDRSGPVDKKIYPLKVYRLSLKLMAMIKFNQGRLTSGCYIKHHYQQGWRALNWRGVQDDDATEQK